MDVLTYSFHGLFTNCHQKPIFDTFHFLLGIIMDAILDLSEY